MWMRSLATGMPCGGEPGDRGGRASPRGQDASSMMALTLAREKRLGGEKQPQG
jgi:hypothetical protein